METTSSSQENFKKGMTYLKSGDYSQAISTLNQMMHEPSDNNIEISAALRYISELL